MQSEPQHPKAAMRSWIGLLALTLGLAEPDNLGVEECAMMQMKDNMGRLAQHQDVRHQDELKAVDGNDPEPTDAKSSEHDKEKKAAFKKDLEAWKKAGEVATNPEPPVFGGNTFGGNPFGAAAGMDSAAMQKAKKEFLDAVDKWRHAGEQEIIDAQNAD